MADRIPKSTDDAKKMAVKALTGAGIPELVARLIVAGVAAIGKKVGTGAAVRFDDFARQKVPGYERLRSFLEKEIFAPDPVLEKLDQIGSELLSEFSDVLAALASLDVLTREGRLGNLETQGFLRIPVALSIERESPTTLLAAHNEFVPLIGRDQELSRLQEFLERDDPFRWIVLTGAGGVGKSRLALEFAKRAADRGWAAGFMDAGNLDLFVHEDAFPGWAPPLDTLIVIDYAARKVDDLKRLLQRGARYALGPGNNRASPRLRVILLERQAAEREGWLASIFTSAEGDLRQALHQMQDSPPALELLPPVVDDPVATTRELLAAASGRWQSLFHEETPDVSSLSDESIEGLNERLERKPLYLLAAAVSAFHHKSLMALEEWTWKELLDDLVQWEKRHWLSILHPTDDKLPAILVYRAAAALQFLGELRRENRKALEEFIDWDLKQFGYGNTPGWGSVLWALERVLPPGEEGTLRPLQPDLLGEAFAVRALSESKNRVSPVVTIQKILDLTPGRQTTWSLLFQACADLRYTEGYQDIEKWLETLFEKLDLEDLQEADRAMPEPHVDLEPLRARLRQHIVVITGEIGKPAAELAAALANLSVAFARAGRRQEALEPAQEAVDIYRKLNQQNPDAFPPELAASLNNLALSLSELGQRQEAVKPAGEAVAIYRNLAQHNSDAFLPNLAMSLNNLATFLSELGQRQEALKPAQEAATIYRNLVQRNQDAFLPDLATSLNNLAAFLSNLGRRQEALKPAQEAVQIRRQLAQRNPDAFLPDLATSLNNLAAFLSELGRRQEAVKPAQEAVQIYRKLAERNPDAFLPDLAASLNNLAIRLSQLGQRQEALEPAQEAVQIRRKLAQRSPDTFFPDLAASLNNLAILLTKLGRRQEALEPAQEAVDIRRKLAQRNPDAFLPDLAGSLNNLALFLTQLGRLREALTPAHGAVDIYRKLARVNSRAFRPDLARSLGTLGGILLRDGQPGEAEKVFREGLTEVLPLARELPEAFAELVSSLLSGYGMACKQSGLQPDGKLVREVQQVLEQATGERG